MRSEYTLLAHCADDAGDLDLKFIVNERKNMPGKHLFRKWKTAAGWRKYKCQNCPEECKIRQLSEMSPTEIGLIVVGSAFIV